ncbi:unnamed protein product [Blepharisma stoltei]|uniref:Cyclin-like domain-containing protein n=1 Tax=Blepharisma stoltei TaxID=1481888 RepID=A0AAU9IJG4_9CILI|nr:unnamed protein product [Blepharisma stoltei]
MDYECSEMDIETESKSSTEGSQYLEITSSSCVCFGDFESIEENILDDMIGEIKDTEGMWKPKSDDYIMQLKLIEEEYKVNSLSIQNPLGSLTVLMRAILIDWMMEVCSDLLLHRETFHTALSHLNRAVMKMTNINKDNIQKIALLAIWIAAKEEEKPICLKKLVKVAEYEVPQGEILAMEREILYLVGWKIFPPTHVTYLNCILGEWDEFLTSQYGIFPCNSYVYFKGLNESARKREQDLLDFRMITYKQLNQYSYKRYRELMQILDTASMDISFLNYKPSTASGALIYVMASKAFSDSEYLLLRWDGIKLKKPGEIEEKKIVHDTLSYFLCKTLCLKNIEEIEDCAKYIQQFLSLHFSYHSPMPYNKNRDNGNIKIENQYEDFLAFQTYNPFGLRLIEQKLS